MPVSVHYEVSNFEAVGVPHGILSQKYAYYTTGAGVLWLHEVCRYFPSRSKGKITDGEIDKQGPRVPIFTGSPKFMTP